MTQRKLDLVDELLVYDVFALVGLACGSLSSWLNPFFIPSGIKNIHDHGLKGEDRVENLSLCIYAYSATWSYLNGVSNILEDLVKEPTNPVNYIPLALNVASGVGQVCYNIGRRQQR